MSSYNIFLISLIYRTASSFLQLLSPCAVNSSSSSDCLDHPSPMFLSAVTSLCSASFIPVTSCISSIHFLLGRPLLLLPSPYASIILFFSPSDHITFFFPVHLIV